MDSYSELIKKSFDYYDTNKMKHKGFYDKVKFVSYHPGKSDIDKNIIKMYDKKKREIYVAEYEYIAEYSRIKQMWVWAWGLLFEKNRTYLISKLVDYGLNIFEYSYDDLRLYYLKIELISLKLHIENDMQIDKYLALSSYLTKTDLILTVPFVKYVMKQDEGKKLPIHEKNENNVLFYDYLFLKNVEKTKKTK